MEITEESAVNRLNESIMSLESGEKEEMGEAKEFYGAVLDIVYLLTDGEISQEAFHLSNLSVDSSKPPEQDKILFIVTFPNPEESSTDVVISSRQKSDPIPQATRLIKAEQTPKGHVVKESGIATTSKKVVDELDQQVIRFTARALTERLEQSTS